MKMSDINTVYKHILHAPQHNWMFCQHDILKEKRNSKLSKCLSGKKNNTSNFMFGSNKLGVYGVQAV